MKELRRTIILTRLRRIRNILDNAKGKISKKDRDSINRFIMTLPPYIFRFVVQQVHYIEKHRKEKK
jgi:hypothetical protein